MENVDRLPVIVSDSQGTAKLLGVRKLPAGTREATASAVLHCLREWQLQDKVVGMSVDTTCSPRCYIAANARTATVSFCLSSSRTGTGGRSWIYNMLLSILGLEIVIFKRFQSNLNDMDQCKFKPMMPDELDSAVLDIFSISKEQVVFFLASRN